MRLGMSFPGADEHIVVCACRFSFESSAPLAAVLEIDKTGRARQVHLPIWQVGKGAAPRDLRIGREAQLRTHRFGIIEAVDGHTYVWSVHLTVEQGCTAMSAESSFDAIGAGKYRWRMRPLNAPRRKSDERHERPTRCLLAHATVADARPIARSLRPISHRSALTTANMLHDPSISILMRSLQPRIRRHSFHVFRSSSRVTIRSVSALHHVRLKS